MNIAVEGRVGALDEGAETRLFDRGRAADPAVAEAVAALVADVRSRGDAALREQAARFDGVALEALEVPREAWDRALAELDPAVRNALQQAADAIAGFHTAQLPAPLEVELRPGVRLGRRAEPLRAVGVYAPGGRASYPSSVLMGVVPARVAGVAEVVVCSPPGPDGRPPAAVMAACAIGGADRLFALGGAGAVAALALGTASVPRVDKIVGPGNAYVTEAKRQLTGTVAIDCPAGPSEVLIVADDGADAELLAAELIAQAEHDPDAAAVLLSTSADVLAATREALTRLLDGQPRAAIVTEALAARGGLLLADSLDEAYAFATRYAPEHLLLMVADPRAGLARVRSAGTVFLGAGSSVAFGDYLTGANHVLPTAGLARAYAGLSAADFLRWTTYQEVSDDAAASLAAPTATLADAEGLPGHALAARLRARGAAPNEDARGGAGAGTSLETVPFRGAYAGIELYEPGRVPTAVDLSDNTNLWGLHPLVAELFAALPADAVTRYPTVWARRLKEVAAAAFEVAPENVATGCGSDDLIDSAVRAFCEPGQAVAFPEPTFGVVSTFARMNAARPVAVPLGADFALDPAALLATGAALTYICRPNNPTGTRFERAAVERVLAEARGVVLVDEAYADFAPDSLLADIVASRRGLVLRTLSKACGLAGLRVGLAVGPAPLIRELEKSRGPYKVGGVAEAAAVRVLSEGMDWVRARVEDARRARTELAAALAERGLGTWPSEANFVLVAVPAAWPSAAALASALRAAGVAVRAFEALPGAGNALRVTVGPPGMMARFLDALDGVLEAGFTGQEAG
ncbi:MAG: histidinol dehydrogenase [Gemmatimonadota bacterium]